MDIKTSPKANDHEHYPYQCNRRPVRAIYPTQFERGETRLRMQYPSVQSIQLHFVSSPYGLSVGEPAYRSRPRPARKKELSYHAVYHHYRKWSRDGSLERVFQSSIVSIQAQINAHHLNLEGSHALAKKGGEA